MGVKRTVSWSCYPTLPPGPTTHAHAESRLRLSPVGNPPLKSSRRIATFLTYLSDVEEGGETIFPVDGKNGFDRKTKPGGGYRGGCKGSRSCLRV